MIDSWIDLILDGAARVDAALWGPWTIVFIASVSLYLTVRSGFFQLLGLGLIFRTTFGSLLRRPGEVAKEVDEDGGVMERR
ncbi:MAG: hypothetical protein KAJ42_00205, partial [Gemmatimonadetes bacterium]|nr:hypothetical protein [Gemmatimonadota bacterium]